MCYTGGESSHLISVTTKNCIGGENMGKKLKGIGLVLFSICCAVGFSSSVSAETLEMDSDMTAS